MSGQVNILSRGLLDRAEKRWFLAAPAGSLAALRIVVGAYCLMYLWSRKSTFLRIADTHVDLFDPVGLASIFQSPLPAHVFGVLFGLTICLNVAFLLGWGFRLSGPAFGLALLLVLCYRNSWSMVYHTDNLLVLHVLILAFCRAADALSVDSLCNVWLVRRRSASRLEETPPQRAESWRYGWPIQLICTLTILTYFLAGVAKVAGPLGWSWMGGDTLRMQVAVDVLRKELFVDDRPMLAHALFQHAWIFTVGGVATLAIELGAPVAIFSRKFARAWVITAFLMHWGILLVMGIKFRYQLSGVLFFSYLLRDSLFPTTETRQSR